MSWKILDMQHLGPVAENIGIEPNTPKGTL